MTWEPIELVTKKAGLITPVRLSLSKDGTRFTRQFRLIIRLSAIDTPPPFLEPGKRIGLQRGTGEHAGLIRCVPEGMHLVKRISRHIASDMVLISWPCPPGLAPAAVPATAVDYDYKDTWLEITLPAWAKPAPGTTNPFHVSPALRRAAGAAA